MSASNIDCNLEPTENFHSKLGVRPATQLLMTPMTKMVVLYEPQITRYFNGIMQKAQKYMCRCRCTTEDCSTVQMKSS